MEKKINAPLTFREVYRRHRQVWNGLACFAMAVLFLIGYGFYAVWFDSKAVVIDGYVIGKAIVGALTGWALAAGAQRK